MVATVVISTIATVVISAISSIVISAISSICVVVYWEYYTAATGRWQLIINVTTISSVMIYISTVSIISSMSTVSTISSMVIIVAIIFIKSESRVVENSMLMFYFFYCWNFKGLLVDCSDIG